MDWFSLILGGVIGFFIGKLSPLWNKFNKFLDEENKKKQQKDG